MATKRKRGMTPKERRRRKTLQQEYYDWTKKLNARFGNAIKYSRSTRGKSNKVLYDQIRKMRSLYNKAIRTRSGQYALRKSTAAYKQKLIDMLRAQRDSMGVSVGERDMARIYQLVLGSLSRMKVEDFADFYDWMKEKGFLRFITPEVYGEYITSPPKGRKDPKSDMDIALNEDESESDNAIYIVVQALEEYMTETGYRDEAFERKDQERLERDARFDERMTKWAEKTRDQLRRQQERKEAAADREAQRKLYGQQVEPVDIDRVHVDRARIRRKRR